MRVLKWLVAISVLITIPSVVPAYPIPPQPLRKLYNESDLIVVAKVGETTISKDEDGFSVGKVTLQVSSILKGLLYTQYVEVSYPPGLICPAPPSYEEGKIVLAFLRVAKDKAGYYTTGLSYGTKYLSESDLKVYTDRIAELSQIMSQEKVEMQQIVEWLVRCAEEPATRWEGVHEFFPLSMGLRADKSDTKVNFAAMLTEEQKTRLTEAFFRSTTISWSEQLLIGLIQDRKDARLIPFVMNYLKSQTADSLDGLEGLMFLVAQHTGSKELTGLAEKYQGVAYRDDRAAEKRKVILEKFIALFEKTQTH